MNNALFVVPVQLLPHTPTHTHTHTHTTTKILRRKRTMPAILLRTLIAPHLLCSAIINVNLE